MITVVAVTLLGKIAYVLLFVVLAVFVAAYGWLGAPTMRERRWGAESWIAWLVSFLPPSAIRALCMAAAALILVLGGFGVAGGFHL